MKGGLVMFLLASCDGDLLCRPGAVERFHRHRRRRAQDIHGFMYLFNLSDLIADYLREMKLTRLQIHRFAANIPQIQTIQSINKYHSITRER